MMKKLKQIENNDQPENLELYILQKGIEKITEESTSFDFLNNEEDLYSYDDIKE